MLIIFYVLLLFFYLKYQYQLIFLQKNHELFSFYDYLVEMFFSYLHLQLFLNTTIISVI